MRLLIAGSRGLRPSFADIDTALARLATVMGGTIIAGWQPDAVISGGARGVDTCGEDWARYHGIEVVQHVPEWKVYGKSAGHRRNAAMAEDCTAALIWWDGESPGTAGMIAMLVRAGKPHVVREKPWTTS